MDEQAFWQLGLLKVVFFIRCGRPKAKGCCVLHLNPLEGKGAKSGLWELLAFSCRVGGTYTDLQSLVGEGAERERGGFQGL